METALCTADATKYSAIDFAALARNVIASKRHDLQCTACKAKAYFNKGATGHSPFFGAREHLADCTLSTLSLVVMNDDDQRTVTAERIVVQLTPSIVIMDEINSSGNRTSGRTNVQLSGAGSSSDRTVKRGVDGLLNALILHPEFRDSATLIEVGGQQLPASDFFVPLANVSAANTDLFRGFWGTIYSGRDGNGGWTWLNTDSDFTAAIGLPQELWEESRSRFHFKEAVELAGATILVLGKFSTALKCKVEDIYHIAIRVAAK